MTTTKAEQPVARTEMWPVEPPVAPNESGEAMDRIRQEAVALTIAALRDEKRIAHALLVERLHSDYESLRLRCVAAEATLADEEAGHAETLRLWQEAKERCEAAERERDEAQAACHEWDTMYRGQRALAETAERDLNNLSTDYGNLLKQSDSFERELAAARALLRELRDDYRKAAAQQREALAECEMPSTRTLMAALVAGYEEHANVIDASLAGERNV